MPVPTTYGIPDGLIDPADITEGMDIAAVTTYPDASFVQAHGTAQLVTGTAVLLGNNQAGSTVDPDTLFYLMSAPPTPATPEPDVGTILLDETSAAWQRLGDLWLSINGDRLAWAGFLAAHPTYTTLKDSPVTPLPAPVSPYPATIAPDAARLGMDIRVTVTYDTGGTKVVRGVCAWNQSNPPIDDSTPDYLWLTLSIGNVFQYNPLPAGITLLVEQMQDWTAAPDWGAVSIAEPPIGSVVRSSQGVAWQRISDATEDGPIYDGVGPWYTSGQGRWLPVTQSFIFTTTDGLGGLPTDTFPGPINWIYLWAAAAPFNVQEATP